MKTKVCIVHTNWSSCYNVNNLYQAFQTVFYAHFAPSFPINENRINSSQCPIVLQYSKNWEHSVFFFWPVSYFLKWMVHSPHTNSCLQANKHGQVRTGFNFLVQVQLFIINFFSFFSSLHPNFCFGNCDIVTAM